MLDLMSSAERRRLLLLLPAMTLNAIVQVVGVVSVMPFLTLVANPESVRTNDYLSWAYTTLGFQSTNAFLVFVGLGVLGVMIASNAFAAYAQFLVYRFSWDVHHSLSARMLREYIYKPYVFFLDHNSSGLAKNVLGEVKQAVKGYLVAGMELIAHGIVTLFILGLLVSLNPILALIAFAFLGSAYGGVFLAVRRSMSEAGRQRAESDRQRYKAANEALTGVKEIKLLGKERPFLKRYRRPSKRYSRFMAKQQVVGNLPRYAFETLTFGGMLVIVLFLLVQGDDFASVLPTLGAYGFAAYRLMPSLQKIFKSLTSLRFSVSSIELLHHDLERSAPAAARQDRSELQPLPFRQALEFRDVTFSYPNAREPVLRDFDLTIRPNTAVALVGATGSGKTTTVDLILGLLRPQEGELVVDGVPVDDETLPRWQMNLGYVPQEIHLADETVASNIAFGVPPEEVDPEAVERAARGAHIHDFIVSELADGYDTVVGERGIRLSGGQRQRLGIARALYHDPDVLVLDEATSALDNVTEESIFRAVNEIGKTKTVVMIAHRISTVRDCDVIYVLERGRIVDSGRYGELLTSSAAFRALADVDEGAVERAN